VNGRKIILRFRGPRGGSRPKKDRAEGSPTSSSDSRSTSSTRRFSIDEHAIDVGFFRSSTTRRIVVDTDDARIRLDDARTSAARATPESEHIRSSAAPCRSPHSRSQPRRLRRKFVAHRFAGRDRSAESAIRVPRRRR